MTTLEYWIKKYPELWEHGGRDPYGFVYLLASQGIVSWDDVPELEKRFAEDYKLAFEMPEKVAKAVEEEKKKIQLEGWPSEAAYEQAKAEVGDALWNQQRGWLVNAFESAMRSIWEWIKSTFGDFFRAVWDAIQSLVVPLWRKLDAESTAIMVGIYKTFTQVVDGYAPLRPENVGNLIAKLYKAAYGFGIGAHLTALTVEAVHPLKNLGMSQVAAMIGDFSGFGRLAGATIGVLESKVVGTVTSYALMSKFRPVVPDSGTLQTMAVKGDIDLAKFRHLMTYYGYSEEYIDDIVRTMYREPMYRELLMMAESDVATDAWMIDKLRRSGYESSDAPVMHKALLKRIALTQRNSYYSEAFKLFKEGYINQDLFGRILDELELRPEAKHFAIKAASLAYLYDVTTDQVKYWTDSYLKDLISSDELRLHLSLLGVVPERVWLHGQLARVRKYKKPAVAIKSELEPSMSKIQSTYSQGYVQLYRKGLIDEAALEADLIAIGIDPGLAEATVFLEVTRGLK